MWEVVKFPEQNIAQNWGELLQGINEDIEASQLNQEVKKTHNWLVRKFPHLFMTPGELIEYFEKVRNEIEWITDFDDTKALNDQVTVNDNTVPSGELKKVA